MKQSLKTGFNQALTLSAIGLIMGVLAGWAGLLLGDGVEAITAVSARWYQALIVILPMVLLFLTYANLKDADILLYEQIGHSFSLLLLAGILGAVGATLFFLALAANIPAIFGRLDAVQLQRALSGLVWGRNFMIVLGVMTISALLLAGWAYRQANR